MRALIGDVLLGGVFILAASFSLIAAENPAPGSNSDPTYQQLRNLTLSGEVIGISNLTLKRDWGTFYLRSGTVCFVTPVAGKVTGAVFEGDGNFALDVPIASERASLKLLTKEDEFRENFTQAVFRFTDSTYDEIKPHGSGPAHGCDAGLIKDTQNTTRHKFRGNLEVRLLEDVLSSERGGYFVAFIHGQRYSSKEEFEIDPDRESEQVNFWTYEDNKSGHWVSLNVPDRKLPTGWRTNIEHQQLDVTFEKNGSLEGKARADIVSRRNGLRVVPLDLFPSLRVQNVTVDGQPASFVQEDKNDDADYAVILPRVLGTGEKFTVTTTYAGKDAVINQGGGNYYPVARDDWYPNQHGVSLGHYALYDMTLRIPKGMKMAATGVLVSESNEGGRNVTVWKSEGVQTVAGFSFGRFREEEKRLSKPEYLIQSYANEESPDWVQSLQQGVNGDLPRQVSHGSAPVALGTMNTTLLNKKALAEGELAVQLYTDYFGPSMFKHLQLTQQTACNYGQSWPELIWIPICYYFDTTVRHSLGLDNADRGYWKVVAAHEVAHQWWGHTIGFSSGRDQWMSEGFAELSASLYVSMIEKNPKKFLEFWNDEREILLERNAQGFRAIDAGPVTMGYRASNSRTGYNITRNLIYPKGAYVLHMVRMMMWDRKNGDQIFRETMQDFVKTYSGRAATTEDFKAMVEKHMTPEMDLDGNHRLDWFFNEYVYGTALPAYKLDSSFGKDPNGDVLFSFKVTQSGVDDKFIMIVPIYLELADGRIINVGRARLSGNSSIEQKIPIKGLKEAPRRAIVNYNYDVLASN
ncbi:MAG TPA: M1 family aminopeptidase [Terriglobales bacterium]|nr:M1 family aminopeptidase [Terriglobales bacterium]